MSACGQQRMWVGHDLELGKVSMNASEMGRLAGKLSVMLFLFKINVLTSFFAVML